MALKDRLVNLEDLKALKDWIEGRIDMWQDITDTLTWADATWVPQNNTANAHPTKNTEDRSGSAISPEGYPLLPCYGNVKVAKIAVNPGEKYRITSWYTYSNYASDTDGNRVSGSEYYVSQYATAKASDDLITAGTRHNLDVSYYSDTRNKLDWMFISTELTVSKNAKYLYVFDYSWYMDKTTGDIIVEKAQ